MLLLISGQRKVRNKTIEIMKGLSIIGIVLLHAIFIHYGYNTEWSTTLRLVCIETLLVLSGYVIYGKVLQQGWLKEKLIRRLLLLLVWTILYYLFYTFITGVDGGAKITTNIGNYLGYELMSGFDGLVLWYVWQITICTIVLYLFEKYATKIKLPYLLLLFIFIIIVAFLPIDVMGFRYMKWYGLFMFLGYGIHYLIDRIKLNTQGVYISLSALPIALYLTWNAINIQGDWNNSGYINIYQSVIHGDIAVIGIYTIISLLGVAFMYSVAELLSHIKIISSVLVLIGGSTIGILLLHKWVLELRFTDSIWLSSLAALIIALGMYQLLRRVKWLDYLLFGGILPIKNRRLSNG
jgi:hypothetical protein